MTKIKGQIYVPNKDNPVSEEDYDLILPQTTADQIEGFSGKATQEDAEAGTSDDKVMTPLRVKQAMGTMTFIDLLPVGWVSYKEFLLPQHVKANGATVNRSDYPTLAAYATEHNLWTDDPASEPYKYGRGDGSTTMVLPDYRDRVIQGGDITAILAPGLPEISASIHTANNTCFVSAGYDAKGSFFTSGRSGGQHAAGSREQTWDQVLNFAASRSSSIYGASTTVQTAAIMLIPQIKF